jgi:hypothetical protein
MSTYQLVREGTDGYTIQERAEHFGSEFMENIATNFVTLFGGAVSLFFRHDGERKWLSRIYKREDGSIWKATSPDTDQFSCHQLRAAWDFSNPIRY